MNEYRICTRCVMDTSDPDIEFDSSGWCNHCTRAFKRLQDIPYSLAPQQKEIALKELVKKVEAHGRGKQYNCVIGLSGGVDSSYLALRVKELGLRPIAVHLDNGWDSEVATRNIENICKKLNIDLVTRVLDWEEFKDLQLAFLRASTPDSEIPSDHAIIASLYDTAEKYGIKYILSGHNISSESILPKAWSQGHFDWSYIKDVYFRYGTKRKLKDYTHIGKWRMFVCESIKGIKMVPLLDYIEYDKEAAKKDIAAQLAWKDYGRKHGESNYTKIFQEYILPKKFGYDKRRAHYSSLIVAGQMKREDALRALEIPLYTSDSDVRKDIDYLVNKLGITNAEFEAILCNTPKTIHHYKNYGNIWSFQALLRFYRFCKKLLNTGKK